MGVQLGELVSGEQIEFAEMAGKRIAIDALNSLYQFLSIIRQPTGEPLKDSLGRVTSHLSGLLYRNAKLIEYGILPVYVFDGRPSKLKSGVIEERKSLRRKADDKWQRALARGDIEEARIYAQQASQLSSEMLEDSKHLLELMGIPHVKAPSEGEAQAAHMVSTGKVWAVGSQDYDSLLFGSDRLIRNLAISGKRKVPRKNFYVSIKPEIMFLDKSLSKLKISREQLIEIAILIGTDYNPKGVGGIGPKKAYEMISEFGSAERALREKNIEVDFDIEEIKKLFMEYETTDEYYMEWKKPDIEGLKKFLCDERDFSAERVKNTVAKIETGIREAKSQSSLDAWFS